MDSKFPFLSPIPDFPDDDDTGSSDSSLVFFQNLIQQAELLDTASSSKKKYVRRDRVGGHETLMADYFDENPKFSEDTFRHRFRMSKSLFLKIVSDVQAYDEWFQEGLDGRMKKSFTPLQKVTSAIKQLATGNPPDEGDEYLNMSERTSRECLEYFCETVCKRYGGEFLRRPTSHDIALLYQAHEDRHHLPGMLGSLDCTHFVWRMCPTELRGQYMRGDHQYPTVMLEAVVSQDLWIWHAFCGPAGSQNDINVLQQSPLFLAQRNGTAPNCPFQVNNHLYKRGYYLTDGIYPTWSVFVKSFPYPHDPNEKKFKRQHEAARKDVERAFGVLKSKWGILNRPMRSKTVKKIRSIVYTCLILHNMIIKDDGRAIAPVHIQDPPVEPVFDDTAYTELIDEDTHWRLKHDLVEHLGSLDLPHLEVDSDEE
ncbi:putative harbinger transposase-derived protein [Helianthus annuus]|uniref:Harbinger transposase-derived protein n=2 Tax=Helianthus annuus TaxID=4232 RepID=A0A9K3JAY2_HELAN|nr:putative harbinger transposase-derived protein [Helianthus annuus]